MALKTFVKASKINNLSDARYFAALEVDYIGFDGLPTSASYIEPTKQLEIASWLSGPKYCLDVCGATQITSEMQEQSEQLGAVEVDMHFLAASKFNNETTVFTRIYLPNKFDVAFIETLVALATNTDYFILDSKQSQLELAEIKKFVAAEWGKPVMLDIPAKTQHLTTLLETVKGISVDGGNEQEVGLRSFEDVQDLMELLEIEV